MNTNKTIATRTRARTRTRSHCESAFSTCV